MDPLVKAAFWNTLLMIREKQHVYLESQLLSHLSTGEVYFHHSPAYPYSVDHGGECWIKPGLRKCEY